MEESVAPEVLEPKQLEMRKEQYDRSGFENENDSKIIDVTPVQVAPDDGGPCCKNDCEETRPYSNKSRNSLNNDFKEPDKVTKKIIAKMFVKGATMEEVAECVDLDVSAVHKILDDLGLLD